MNKTKMLLNPFSKFLRTHVSTSHFSLRNSTHYSYTPFSFCAKPSTRVQCPHNLFYDSKFSAKSFCDESSHKINSKCWNCNAAPHTDTFLVCESCRSIQPLDHSIDYFQIFGLDRKYEIEVDSLEGKYKDWQKKLHPDLVHSKSEKEREYAADQSARISDAYRRLTKPLSRAKYIMKLDGINVNEEETISEPELLAEIMEIREAVEEAADTQALNRIQSQMQENLKNWSNSFANAFRSRKYDEALNCIRRMTYYERVAEEIVKKL